jgi:hypothetical protein
MFRDFPSPNILSACGLNNFLLARGGRLDKPPFQVRPRFPTLYWFDGVPNHLDSQKIKDKKPTIYPYRFSAADEFRHCHSPIICL